MNFDFSKLKASLFKSSKIRRSIFLRPRELWGKFIWFLIFFALITFAFNGWIFYHFYFNSPAVNELPESAILKPKSFNKAIERIEKKKEKFDNYKNNLIIEDLSIIR